MTEETPKTLLFVCTGNTCRSPMAERLMAERCKNLPGWTCASAGVFASAGAPASALAVEVLREKKIDISDHRARPLSPAMVKQAYAVVTMTHAHRDLVLQMDPSAAEKTRALHSYGSEKPKADVMDPFSGNIDTYRIARDDIDAALNDVLLAVIRPPLS